jgi:hypothetical protein
MYTNKASTGRGRLQLYLSLPDSLSLARSLALALSLSFFPSLFLSQNLSFFSFRPLRPAPRGGKNSDNPLNFILRTAWGACHKTCASPPGLPDATITSAGPAGESCVNVDAG